MLVGKQKDAVSKFLLDVAKIVLAVFVIGGLLPGSPIATKHVIIASVNIFVMFCFGIYLLKER